MESSPRRCALTAGRRHSWRLDEQLISFTALLATVFERCTFTGVDFSTSDLRRLNFDGAAFTGVKFDRAALEGMSMRGAILRDCSFRGGWSSRYYKALRTVNFDGARMDKLTYAALKGFGVEPSNVTVE